MAKAKQNLTKRIKQEQDPAKKARLEERQKTRGVRTVDLSAVPEIAVSDAGPA
jgi:hypothetical protein